MCFAKEEHTDTGLSDTAADGIRQLLIQNRFLEGKLSPVVTSCLCQLFIQSIFIHADTHGRKLKGNVKYRIVYQDIAV